MLKKLWTWQYNKSNITKVIEIYESIAKKKVDYYTFYFFTMKRMKVMKLTKPMVFNLLPVLHALHGDYDL